MFTFTCLLAVLLWVTLNALNSPLWSRLMMNDELMTMKKTGLQYALRTSKMGTGATFSSLSKPSKPLQRLNLNTFPNPHQVIKPHWMCNWPGSLSPPISMSECKESSTVGCIYSINWSLCISVFTWLSVPFEAPAGATQSLYHSNVYHRQSVCMGQREREREREIRDCVK